MLKLPFEFSGGRATLSLSSFSLMIIAEVFLSGIFNPNFKYFI